jgi:hypothetical protein
MIRDENQQNTTETAVNYDRLLADCMGGIQH